MVPGGDIRVRGPDALREGRFVWKRHLSDGGSASVHLYDDREARRVVAVKLLDDRVLSREQYFAKRFVAEARALATLQHPHLIPVYEAGHEQGYYWYAMEFAPLGTLSDRIRFEGACDPVKASRWMFETLLGLHAVHGHGMLHRDIKPSNLLLGRNQEVKIADLGLARHPRTRVDFRTVSGSSMGSHGYAAPELMGDAKRADERADLHAVTATFYHLLTARRPGALLFLTIDDAVLEPVPPAFRAFVMQGVSPMREDRWSSAADMAQALVDAAHTFARGTGRPERPRRWMRSWTSHGPGTGLWHDLWRRLAG